MPIANYGVWTANPVRVSAETAAMDPESPHIHLFYDDGSGGSFDGARRASINVKSKSVISELVFWFIPDFRHPVADMITSLEPGFRPLPPRPGTAALDYIRSNLLDLTRGRLLQHDLPGGPNDMIDYVMPELQAGIARGATVHLFGEPYADRQGIHDIHMNQGSVGEFRKYNGVFQDGAVFLNFPAENRMAALFFAFGSQSVHTDESTGHGLPGSQSFASLLKDRQIPPEPVPPAPRDHTPGFPSPSATIPEDRRIAIVAALVNPEGADNQPGFQGQPETVYLLNRSKSGTSLAGWSILNRMDEKHLFSADIWLATGEMRSVALGTVPLSNKGGMITLLDPAGLKVDGVSYTADDAAIEGQLVIFR